MRLRVLVNASSARLGGGLSYLLAELAAVERTRPEVRLDVFAAPWNALALRQALNCRVRTAPVPNVALRVLYEQLALPLKGHLCRSVLYYPGNFAPVLKGGAPVVLTLQNPNYFGTGPSMPHNQSTQRRLKIAFSRLAVRRSDLVIVISHTLREQVKRDLPAMAHKLRLVTSGAPVWPIESVRPTASWDSGMSYFLSLANDYPHKRLDRLVKAWSVAFTGYNDFPALLLVGDLSETSRSTHRDLAGPCARQLVHAGAVADRRQVRWLVEHAAAMVSVSVLEAHPLTPAEAGAMGCPIILSDIPPHREVARNHALYVPPDDQHALVSALRETHSSPPARTPWQWPVSWDDHARQLVDVWTEAAEAART